MNQPTDSNDLDSSPELSVIAPVFNESKSIIEFSERLLKQLEALSLSYEIILVNDGSTDNSNQLLEDLCNNNHQITCIELTRNFGHQFAISAGLSVVSGRRTIIMDSDLQDPPEVIPELLRKAYEGFDIVYGIRRTRKENPIKKLCYHSFYRLLQLLSNIEIPLDAGDFCLLSQEAVQAIQAFPERNRFLRGLRSWVGYKQVGVEYDRDARYAGKPKYTIRTLIKLALDGLVAFSYRPLRAISAIGIAISLAAFILAIYYTFKKIQFGLTPPGFASTMVAIFFFSGLQLVTLGIIGEYLGRIYEEVKQRPLYLVKRVIGRRPDAGLDDKQ